MSAFEGKADMTFCGAAKPPRLLQVADFRLYNSVTFANDVSQFANAVKGRVPA